MKRIKDIRENYNLVTEKEQSDISKLTSLVRAGLFDAKKINIVKRALEKNPAEMTLAERKILIELLESLMSEVLHSQQVYSKVKQNVMSGKEKINENIKDSYLTKFDPRMTKYPSERDIPVVLILKRKAIRVYPDNQKVALYYAQAIDKYVTIPYGNINTSMNEEYIEEKFEDVPITTYSVKQQEKANKIVDKSVKDPFFKAGLKTGMALRRKVGPTLGKATGATKEYVGKKVDQAVKKPKISLRNLTKGFKADRAAGQEKNKLNPRSYDNKIISPKSSPMYKIGKKVSGLGKKTGMFEDSEHDINELAPLIPLAVGGARIGASLLAKTLAKQGTKARAPKVKPKNEPEVPTTKPTEVKPKKAQPDKTPDTEPAKIPKPKTEPKPDKKSETETKPKPDTKTKPDTDAKPASKPSLAKRIGAGAAGALGVGALAAAAGGSRSGQPREKKFTEPGQFKLGAKISSAEKFDTEVARNRKRESQYDKSLTTSESVISQLYTIKESHNEGFINIDNNNVAINKIVAEKVINVFESLNEENQKKVSTMLNESVDSFKKIINFAVRQ
jgi:hypothetical protein